MKLTSFKKFAAVSAVALGAALYGSYAHAVNYQIGDPIPFTIDVAVENTVDVVVTNLDFGTVGSLADDVDIATFILNPDGTFTDNPGDGFYGGAPASIVSDPGNPPAAGTVALTAAFANTDIYVDYDTLVDPTNGTETFTLSLVNDDLTTPGSYDGTTHTQGIGTTNGAGALGWNVGASISTELVAGPDPSAYPDGAYAGSFEMIVTY